MHDIINKTDAYYHICKVYDTYAGSLDRACRAGCAHCCTINVTLTSLEGYLIVEAFRQSGRMDLLTALKDHASRQRFIPRFTFNRLTEMMIKDETVPEEVIDPEWGACALLSNDQCPIYDVRPFACRCMISQRTCRPGEYAVMPPVTVSVNHVMLQYIEHVDSDGFTGNMTDVLIFMQSEENRKRYLDGGISFEGQPFVPNFPARRLLVEPEHKNIIGPLLEVLNTGQNPSEAVNPG